MPEYGNLELPHIERKHHRKIRHFLGVIATRRASASSTRARTSATTPTPDSAERFWVSRTTLLGRSSTPRWTISSTASTSSTTRASSRPTRSTAGRQARGRRGQGAGPRHHRRLQRGRVGLGSEARHPALQGLSGDEGHHVHLWRPEGGRGRRRRPPERPGVPGFFARGELVGGVFFNGHPGGSGLTSGAVSGRRADRGAVGRTGSRYQGG